MAGDVVAAWLRAAREDVRIAEACLGLAEPATGGAAFHCQQAAEKLLKALLTHRGVHPPKTHDLTRLLDLLPRGDELRGLLDGLEALSPYAVAGRYPDADWFGEPVDEPSADLLRGWVATLTETEARLRAALLPPPARE